MNPEPGIGPEQEIKRLLRNARDAAGSMPHPGPEVGPSRAWHLAVVGVFLLCVLAVPYLLVGESIRQFISAVSLFQGEQFPVPGVQSFELHETGKYVIWSEDSAFSRGRRYLLPDEIPPGLSVRVVDEGRGLAIPVQESMGTTEQIGGTTRHSLFSFEIEHPGTYTITVGNIDPGRVFMLRPSLIARFGDLFVRAGKRLAVAGLSVFAGFIIAPLFSIFVEIRRRENERTRDRQIAWMREQGYLPPT